MISRGGRRRALVYSCKHRIPESVRWFNALICHTVFMMPSWGSGLAGCWTRRREWARFQSCTSLYLRAAHTSSITWTEPWGADGFL